MFRSNVMPIEVPQHCRIESDHMVHRRSLFIGKILVDAQGVDWRNSKSFNPVTGRRFGSPRCQAFSLIEFQTHHKFNATERAKKSNSSCIVQQFVPVTCEENNAICLGLSMPSIPSSVSVVLNQFELNIQKINNACRKMSFGIYNWSSNPNSIFQLSSEFRIINWS
jgi:hypothetical protein